MNKTLGVRIGNYTTRSRGTSIFQLGEGLSPPPIDNQDGSGEKKERGGSNKSKSVIGAITYQVLASLRVHENEKARYRVTQTKKEEKALPSDASIQGALGSIFKGRIWNEF